MKKTNTSKKKTAATQARGSGRNKKAGTAPAEISGGLPYPAHVLVRLRSLRKARHLTQEQVASQLGISQQTYSEYERGITQMHIEEFVSLARLFNVSVDYMAGVSNLIRSFPKY